MNPVLLQKQLKDNAADLNEFYKDLKAWGEDMKRKEEPYQKPVTNKSSTNEGESELLKKKKIVECKEKVEKPKTKLGYTDYSAWDKFDVDAECEKIDVNENEESDLTDECDDTLKDEAYLHKEKGNKYVKDRKWDEAIECYTKAINIYSYDPVFYANRALCFLKKENYMQVETDCTMSIRLDETYVKAYQRRAAAREALHKLSEAQADLLKVLELEPKNKESLSNLDRLVQKLNSKCDDNSQRPVSKFTASRNMKINNNETGSYRNVDASVKGTNLRKAGDSKVNTNEIIPVKAVHKPVHLQSKKPLKRINIEEIDGFQENINESYTRKIQSMKTDDLKVIERQPPSYDIEVTKETKNLTNINKMNEVHAELCAPRNAVQFYDQWRHFKTVEDKYKYLKLIKPQSLPIIFKECLDSNIFSEILKVLVECFIKHNDELFDFLKFFTEIRRFSTILLFLNDTDKKYIWNLFEHVKQHENYSNEEIEALFKCYEF